MSDEREIANHTELGIRGISNTRREDRAHRDPLGSAPNSPTPPPTALPTPTPPPPPLLARDALATALDPLSCLSLCFPGSVFDRLNSEGIVRPKTALLSLSLSLNWDLNFRAKRVSVDIEQDQGRCSSALLLSVWSWGLLES